MKNRDGFKRQGSAGIKIFIAILCLLQMPALRSDAQNYGLLKPQDANTLPKSLAPIPKPVKKQKVAAQTVLKKIANDSYSILNGWEMAAENKAGSSFATISKPGYNTAAWYNATVPGTVLTTLVDQGVYADPYWGINNLSIPDTLCRQNWWYRTAFEVPATAKGKLTWLTFNGINYQAEIWLNGHEIGQIAGAFKKGVFNVSKVINPTGKNILTVHIVPPPHPGIPHEQSILAGRGPNGGALCQDGPTFIASEGWDWLPGIRDRNIGIWQDVVLSFSNKITIADPQIITDLPLPDTTAAAITIKTVVHNNGDQQENTTVTAMIGDKRVSQQVTVLPGESKSVVFSPGRYPGLNFKNPRLWWPNGYGAPNLYTLDLSASIASGISDHQKIRFGIRELSYELTVDAPDKKDWRVEFNPTDVAKKTDQPIFDNTKRRKVVGETLVSSLSDGADASLLKDAVDKAAAPYIVIKVNGKRIFCKGGNWGMDDGLKRVSREKLEPYFKLTREANFNMVRNWTGESTEEVFYDLCDEYGLLVWNDFWISTENYNLLPSDNALFLDNAKDVVKRFRNHACIALWCPRNEGYAPAGLEPGLAAVIAAEDGTRYYQPNSRYLNLRTSGPWYYQKDPKVYFTKLAEGFSTELGTPSVPTAATMRSMMAKEDLWPISDVWHYHDFHFGQKDYVTAIDSLYGKTTGLDDFCKKAQMVNYDSHRTMFESFNSKLWSNASGMLIWMSHPSWPSTVWQAYSSDYETYGSYYGSKVACEPVHIQMNLHDNKVVIINTTIKNINNAKAKITLFDLKGKKLYEKEQSVDAGENRLTYAFTPEIPAGLPPVYLARLQLKDTQGKLLSQNDYWKNSGGDFMAFNELSQAKLNCQVISSTGGKMVVKISNMSPVTAVAIKLNLKNTLNGKLILPAYCSDGYFNLLPGETRELTFTYKTQSGKSVGVSASAYNMNEGMISRGQ